MNSPDDKKIRLFTALAVPPFLGMQIDALPRRGLEGRWSPLEDFHITLRFIGDVSPEVVPNIQEALERVRRPEFMVVVQGLGFFGTGRQAVLYAAVASTRKMTALCAGITDALAPVVASLGIEFLPRPFIPHITLARLNRLGGLAGYIEDNKKQVSARWEAKSFCLMRSRQISEKGSHYSVLNEYPLMPEN